jgi:hypothetical protein
VRSLPPRPFAVSLIITALVVWAVPRALITSGTQVIGAVSGAPMTLRPVVRLLLAFAVSGVVLLDVTRTRERVFIQNLGVAPLTILGIGFGTALACEGLVSLIPGLLALVAKSG